MSVYDSVIKGLNEAIDLEKGKTNGSRRRIIKILPLPKYTGVQVKEIRNRLDLTQSVFAELMGVSAKTVEAWEAGKNIPNGPAQRMLDLLVKDKDIAEKYVYTK